MGAFGLGVLEGFARESTAERNRREEERRRRQQETFRILTEQTIPNFKNQKAARQKKIDAAIRVAQVSGQPVGVALQALQIFNFDEAKTLEDLESRNVAQSELSQEEQIAQLQANLPQPEFTDPTQTLAEEQNAVDRTLFGRRFSPEDQRRERQRAFEATGFDPSPTPEVSAQAQQVQRTDQLVQQRTQQQQNIQQQAEAITGNQFPSRRQEPINPQDRLRLDRILDSSSPFVDRTEQVGEFLIPIFNNNFRSNAHSLFKDLTIDAVTGRSGFNPVDFSVAEEESKSIVNEITSILPQTGRTDVDGNFRALNQEEINHLSDIVINNSGSTREFIKLFKESLKLNDTNLDDEDRLLRQGSFNQILSNLATRATDLATRTAEVNLASLSNVDIPLESAQQISQTIGNRIIGDFLRSLPFQERTVVRDFLRQLAREQNQDVEQDVETPDEPADTAELIEQAGEDEADEIAQTTRRRRRPRRRRGDTAAATEQPEEERELTEEEQRRAEIVERNRQAALELEQAGVLQVAADAQEEPTNSVRDSRSLLETIQDTITGRNINEPTADFIRNNEGVRTITQQEEVGEEVIPTVGIGFNLNREDADEILREVGLNDREINAVRKSAKALTPAQIEQIFQINLQQTQEEAKNIFPEFETLPDDVRKVVIDMIFNLGSTRFQEFNGFIEAVKAGDFERAADEIEFVDPNDKDNSELTPFFSQTGRRARRLQELLRRNA